MLIHTLLAGNTVNDEDEDERHLYNPAYGEYLITEPPESSPSGYEAPVPLNSYGGTVTQATYYDAVSLPTHRSVREGDSAYDMLSRSGGNASGES